MNKTIRVTSFSELHAELDSLRSDIFWAFRGQSNPDWNLIPKAGRDEYLNCDDDIYFAEWKRNAIEYLPTRPNSSWEWLAIAQHHGLATRLLDWTDNPLVAAFFAVWEEHEGDAILYAHRTTEIVNSEPSNLSPFDLNGVARWIPLGILPRITRQAGIFTIHSPPTEDLAENLFDDDALVEIVIDVGYRSQLQEQLSFYGINRATLFPDMDGMAQHHNWRFRSREFEFYRKNTRSGRNG